MGLTLTILLGGRCLFIAGTLSESFPEYLSGCVGIRNYHQNVSSKSNGMVKQEKIVENKTVLVAKS